MMADDQAGALAIAAVVDFGNSVDTPRLVTNRENAVFETVLMDGTHIALRVHRRGYQTRAAIESELTWMMLLARAGFRCCTPVPTLSGRLTTKIDGWVVSAVRWLYGIPIGAAGVPLDGNKAQQVALFGALGRMMAKLHNASDQIDLPAEFVRPYWDEDGLLGEAPLWGRFWENPSLNDAEQDLILDAREKAMGELRTYRQAGVDFGLIHADVLRENVLMDEAGLALIDFDDCGFGFRLYELGCALSQHLEEPHLPALTEAMIAGYRSLRDQPDIALVLLPMFVMLRSFASAGWVISRQPADDPKQRVYAERALTQARTFMG